MYEEMNNVVNEAVEPAIELVEATARKSGKGAVAVVAVAAGVMAVGAIIVGGFKLGAKVVKEQKAKKELRKPDENVIVEPTEEQILEAAK